MTKKAGTTNDRMQAWIDARKRHGLSHAEVQMARDLGMNPKKLGKLDNHGQAPWKMPLRHLSSICTSNDLGRNDLTSSKQWRKRSRETRRQRCRDLHHSESL